MSESIIDISPKVNVDFDALRETMHQRAICVVVPTYNNVGTIEQVVRDVCKYCADVIVVDDGCTDDTANVLQTIKGVDVVRHAQNKGKGAALKSGFERALQRGFAYAITLDADGQHLASDLPTIVEANKQFPGSIIVGERNLEGVDRSAGSSFANKFSNFWFAVQTGRVLRDTQTGYRLYPLRKLVGLKWITSRYEAELELMVFAVWYGVNIHSVPIHVYYPSREERVSHFRPAYDFMRISVLNTVLTLVSFVYGWPLKLLRGALKCLRTAYALAFFLIASLLIFMPWVWCVLHFGKMTENKRCHLRRIIYHFARMVMIYHGVPGVKFTYHVNSKVNFQKPHLIVCNHQSHLDLMSQLIFTDKIVFLTNDWVWNSPFFGLLIRNAEYLPVSSGMDEMLPKLRLLVARGYSIAIYPEGTRSVDLQVHRFHKGALMMAHTLDLDILPMYLYGTGRVLRKKSHHLNPGQIHVEVDAPITLSQLTEIGTLRQQTSWLHRHYVERVAQLANYKEQNA